MEALDTAAAAVLLLSPAFFRSDFIATHELPDVLAAAARGELLVVLPLVLAPCAHDAVTAIFQSVRHDPAVPLDSLDDAGRHAVWQRLLASLNDVAASIDHETHVGAESVRLGNDVAASADVAHILDKIARASVDPAFDGNEAMRENTRVFLEGQRCQAVATWLMVEMKRPDLMPFRSKAVIRMLEQVGREQEVALGRATGLTQEFANQALAMLPEAKGSGGAQRRGALRNDDC